LRSDSQRGFTLIEVLCAVLIVSLVFGLLLESVTRNLHDLSRARNEARAAQLSEDRLRDLKAELAGGEKVEDGVTEGAFDPPDDDMRWQISISPQTLMLPADYKGEVPPSPLFSTNGEPRPAPTSAAPGQPPPANPLRLVEVRVFKVDTDPNTVDPFVLLITAAPDASKLPQNGQQPGQLGGAPGQNQGTGTGMGGPTPRPGSGIGGSS
jgi:prepilin-type N-terminal cleavage/methylation domain-containing protein